MTDRDNILLISPAGWQKESINLGLAYLASSLDAAGFSPSILDLNRYPLADEAVIEYARARNPLLIGISIKTATAREGARLAALLHAACPGAHISCGGPHMTLCAEDFMRATPAVATGIMGEGEIAMARLAEAVRDGAGPAAIPNIVWRRDGGGIAVNDWHPPEDLDGLPFPNLDAIEGFGWEGFRYPIVTSRGCPFDCIYCCVNKLTGSRKWRYRSPENVIEELETVVREKGVTHFEIWDDNFTLDLKRAKRICRLLIDRGLNLSWYCHNGIRADRIDLELARLMKRAGCTSIAFGIESGNPATFDAINKGEPLSAVVEAVRLVKSVGIDAVGYFIIGLPGDNLERFVETVRFQRDLKLHHYVFGMLIPYPHTEVWDMVQRDGTLFCEITETQHFSDDIVPISFELPGFPKADMVRAFYIARHFDLLEAVERISRRRRPRVVYMAAPEILPHLAGLIIAAGADADHVVVGADEAAVRAEPSFAQVPADIRIEFRQSPAPELDTGDAVFICKNLDIPRELLFSASGLVLIDLTRPLNKTIMVRRPMRPLPLVPTFVLSGAGVLLNVSYLFKVYGGRKLREVVRIQVGGRVAARLRSFLGAADRLARRCGERLRSLLGSAQGVARRCGERLRAGCSHAKASGFAAAMAGARSAFLGTLLRRYRSLSLQHRERIGGLLSRAAVIWQANRFVLVKMRLKRRRESTNSFPYDDHSSYL